MYQKTIKDLFPKAKLQIKTTKTNDVLEGTIFYNNQKLLIKNGILYSNNLSKEAKIESIAVKKIDDKAKNPDQAKLFDALASLPQGKANNSYFHSVTPFFNIALGQSEYLRFVKNLPKKQTILEIGADSGWSCANLAKNGHYVIGLDITHHLELRSFWQKQGVKFDCVCADMNSLPFADNLFDLIFASASIHHSPRLIRTASEIYRVLRPGGKFIFLREPMEGNWSHQSFGKKERALGISENIYIKRQWREAFKSAGFQKLKLDLTHLDYFNFYWYLGWKQKLIFILKYCKKQILNFIPILQELTITDYNYTGEKKI